MRKKNQEIRDYAKSKGVYLYQLAERNGISYNALLIRLRKSLNQKQKDKYLHDIDEIALLNIEDE